MRDLRLPGSARSSRITPLGRKWRQSFRWCCCCCFLFLTRRGGRIECGEQRLDSSWLLVKSKPPPCLSQERERQGRGTLIRNEKEATGEFRLFRLFLRRPASIPRHESSLGRGLARLRCCPRIRCGEFSPLFRCRRGRGPGAASHGRRVVQVPTARPCEHQSN